MSAADTAAELMAYDVVILGDTGYLDHGYTSAMYAALRSYLDSGGGVLTTGWNEYMTNGFSGQMRLDADYVSPAGEPRSYSHYDGRPGTIDISGDHDVTAGLDDFAYSGAFWSYAVAIDSDATSLATLSERTDVSTIAVKQQGDGRSVYLGGLYMGDPATYQNAGLRTGVEDRLLEQSVSWAAGTSSESSATAAVPLPGVATAGLALMGGMGLKRGRRKSAAA